MGRARDGQALINNAGSAPTGHGKHSEGLQKRQNRASNRVFRQERAPSKTSGLVRASSRVSPWSSTRTTLSSSPASLASCGRSPKRPRWGRRRWRCRTWLLFYPSVKRKIIKLKNRMSEVEFMALFHDTLENKIRRILNLWGGEHGTFPHPAYQGVHCKKQLWGKQRKVR